MNLFGINLFGSNDKNYLEEFEKDKQSVNPPFRPIDDDKSDSALDAFDELHGYASKLSGKNQDAFKWTLRLLTILGVAIALVFVLYDELDWHWLSALFFVLVFLLIVVRAYAVITDCHRKYVEYRILAEATRIQYYLSVKGIQKPVFEIMPWFLKDAVGWIEGPLSELPIHKVTERKNIKDCWIIDQKEYHENKLNEVMRDKKIYDLAEMIFIFATILLYLFAFLYEFYIFDFINSIIPFSPDFMHVLLKIALGVASAGLLLFVSYFGKMSLSEKIDDHSRMVKLYEMAEEDINNIENNPEELEKLAREFLIENSTWYSYQINNKPELVV